MIIKVDVDGVIRNMNEKMCSLYNETYGEHLTVSDIVDYDVEKVFTKTMEVDGIKASDFFFKKHAHEVFFESGVYDDVAKALRRLQNLGHKVVIVTWQFTVENKILTLLFFEKNRIPYDDICFTRDKWMIQGDWLIDDNPEFIEDEREKSSKIMIRMPYNKECKFFCTRANNLQQAVDIILEQEQYLKTFLIKEQNKRTEKVLKIEIPELSGDDYKKIFNYGTD